MSGRGKIDPSSAEALTIYELCREFRKLPSEIYSESREDVEMLLIIHDAINQENKKQEKKSKRDGLKKSHGGGGRR